MRDLLHELNKMSLEYLSWSALLPLILLLAVRVLWKQGLRNYNSASSSARSAREGIAGDLERT